MRRAGPWSVGALGAALLVAGVLAFVAANRPGPGSGPAFRSYAPLEPAGAAYRSELTISSDDRWAVLWAGGHLTGIGLAVLGLLVLAVLAGWSLGRRVPPRGSPAAR